MKGLIRKRGNKYAFVLDVGYDENGKRKQKWFSGYHSRPDAEKAMTKTIQKLNEGTYVEPSKEIFRHYIENWLERKKEKVRPPTAKTYDSYIRNYIIPGLGDYRLDKLTDEMIEDLYSNMLKKYASWTLVKTHRVLKTVLNYAEARGHIQQNPIRLVDAPGLSRKELQVWDEKQVRLFLDTAKKESRYYIAFMLALTTGMRKGEVLGLRWKDIDVKNWSLSVNQTLSNDGKQFQEAKTDGSHRSIALPLQTMEALKEHRTLIKKDKMKAGPTYKDNGLVVCTKLGTKILPKNLTRAFEKVMNKAELPHIRFHDLRHTHATIMLKQGVHPKIVSERLGHSSVQVTLDTYSHILPGLQDAAAAQFGDEIFGKENPDYSNNL